jgi:hypothetical protein
MAGFTERLKGEHILRRQSLDESQQGCSCHFALFVLQRTTWRDVIHLDV